MRAAILVSLLLLSGCGSCVEEKKNPEGDPGPPPVTTVMKTLADGGKAPLPVGVDRFKLSDLPRLDAGAADAGQ